MSLILNIDTATEEAHVSIAREGVILQYLVNSSQKEHASFLQLAIQQLVNETGINLANIDAVAVNAGPGSYTGLRVGMASAKGLCYGLNKPLLTLVGLEILAASALHQLTKQANDLPVLLCPMIDARRMEVYTALYNTSLVNLVAPCAMILDENAFTMQLANNNIQFFGNGSSKWAAVCKDSHAFFIAVSIFPDAMSRLSHNLFNTGVFTELIDSQPIYLKEFHNIQNQ